MFIVTFISSVDGERTSIGLGMFGDMDDCVCWKVVSDSGFWYVDGNCYVWRLSLVGVLFVLRFLFGSVC